MPVNLVLYGGDIHTMDAAQPRARAIAIAGNRIVALGGDAEMRALLMPGGEALDLQGCTVVPGFIESHAHLLSYGLTLRKFDLRARNAAPRRDGSHLEFLSYGLSLIRIDLTGAATLDEALARVAAVARTSPPGEWLAGQGWDHSPWGTGGFPARHDLDRAAPGHPVWLQHRCGHIGWASTRALELAGVTAQTPDPPGGAIEHDPSTGEPTGILKETAMDAVFRLFDDPSLEEAMAAIRAAQAEAHRHGLVGVHSMEGAAAFRALQALRAAGDLKLRVLMQIPEENLDAAIQAGIQSGFGDARLRIGGVKIFADGAMGARTAHMLEPYHGEPDNWGMAGSDPEHLRAVIGRASRAGIAAFVHAIGDRANREVLDAIEVSRQADKGPGLRHRIEHVQILHPDDVPRLARLGVIASMQPIHATQDRPLADALWGKRCAYAYAWRSLLDAGTVLAFGSDSPVEDWNPLKGIHAAVTRRRADGSPGPEGWYPEQRLTVEEAVRGYTTGAAYASGEEAIKGSLAPGKLADLAILSQDIFAIDPMAILDTEVVATLFDGEFVYRQEGLANS